MATKRIPREESVLFVGDIHGNLDAMTKAIRWLGADNKVFVGDYIDSFPHSRADQKRCLKKVKELHKEDGYYFLRGNHENGYLNREAWGCTGYSRDFHKRIAPILNSIDFLDCVIVGENILVTHAGVSKLWVNNCLGSGWKGIVHDSARLGALESIFHEWREIDDSPLYKVGEGGGLFGPSGPFWCRPNDFEPIGDDIIQIFGHTKHQKVTHYEDKRAYCIDCLEQPQEEYQFLLYKGDSTMDFETITL